VEAVALLPRAYRDTARAMSQENVELAARFYEPQGSKAEILAAMPRAMELCHPDIEWIDDPSRADGATHHGRDGVREALERWLESIDEYRFEVQRIVDCGDARVLVVGREFGRGAKSGAEISTVNYELLTFRDGKIVRYQEFYDRAEALEAAGLSE
jgi:ketosteroid isomerase-like protein